MIKPLIYLRWTVTWSSKACIIFMPNYTEKHAIQIVWWFVNISYVHISCIATCFFTCMLIFAYLALFKVIVQIIL